MSRGRRAGGGCRAGRGTGSFRWLHCGGGSSRSLPGAGCSRSQRRRGDCFRRCVGGVSGCCTGETCGKPLPPSAGESCDAEPGIAKVFFVGLRAGGRSLSRGCMEHVWLNGACGPDACKSVPERARGRHGVSCGRGALRFLRRLRPPPGFCAFGAAGSSRRMFARGKRICDFFWGGESCAATCPQERAACPGRGCGPAPGGSIQ